MLYYKQLLHWQEEPHVEKTLNIHEVVQTKLAWGIAVVPFMVEQVLKGLFRLKLLHRLKKTKPAKIFPQIWLQHGTKPF